MSLSHTTNRVLKVIGIFSGAEIFKILCAIIKTKIVAIWLGAVGVGLFGIFNSTFDTITILTGLGLRKSGVRDVAQHRGNPAVLSRIANLLRCLTITAGTIGALVVCALSPLLSQWCFGNEEHWWQFIILSGAILLTSLTDGEQAILQATNLFRNIAKSSAVGSFIGLLISIPLFRYLDSSLSIPLSFIAYTLAVAVLTLYWRNKEIPYIFYKETKLREGYGMIKLGGFMAMAAFATSVANVIFMAWLNREASTAEVGFFQAGNTIVVRYTSIIFAAVGLEFYPRMAANSLSPHRMGIFVSHELGLLLKIFTPLIIIFLLCRTLLVDILYSEAFEVIIPFITVAILSIIIKSASTCMAFTIVAKGEGKTYFVTETVDAIIGVILNILFYRSYGLFGIGIAQVIWYATYLLMISIIYFCRYRMKITHSALYLFFGSTVVTTVAVILMLGT